MHGGPLIIVKANEEDEEEGFGRSGCFVLVYVSLYFRSVSRQPPDLIYHFQQRHKVNKPRVWATSCGKTDHLRPYV